LPTTQVRHTPQCWRVLLTHEVLVHERLSIVGVGRYRHVLTFAILTWIR
jgi:hypothetical protein